MGFSCYVYPGAYHTRFEHALGAMHLMQEVIEVLRKKGVQISGEESEAMQLAILLHDIGHGPFSHTTEALLATKVTHEEISLEVMKKLNDEFNGVGFGHCNFYQSIQEKIHASTHCWSD